MVKIESANQPEYLKLIDDLSSDSIHFIDKYEFWIAPNFLKQTFKGKLAVFKECLFVGHVYFTDTNIAGGVSFEKCTFRYGLTFDNCISEDHHYLLSDNSPFSISFSNCEVGNRFIVKSCQFMHDILIHRDCKIADIEFSESKMPGIRVLDSTVQGQITINDFDLDDLNFDRSTFLKTIFLKKCNGEFNLTSSNFQNKVNLEECIMGALLTQQLHMEAELELKDCKVNGIAQLNDSIFEKNVLIGNEISFENQKSYIEELHLRASDFKGGFSFYGNSLSRNLDVGNIEIACSNRLKGDLSFTGLSIRSICFFGINEQSILLAYSHVSIINLSGLINKGAFSLVSIYPILESGPQFYISSSVLGKTFISDCDLSKFKKIEITNSNLTELTTTSVRWFEDYHLNDDLPPEKTTGQLHYFHTKREIYRQLKFAMERQGDAVGRLEFKRKELNSYRNELKQYKWNYRMGDKLILWLGQSNDYGFNWLKPIALILIFTLGAYTVLAICSNPFLTWQPSSKDFWFTINFLKVNFYNYFILLNPAHKLSELFKIKDNDTFGFWFAFWDFLDRLIISYLIFQMITAFRKYVS